MKRMFAAAVIAAAVAVVVPAIASAHAVVSAFSPAGTALTGARTVYVLRVPNERPDRTTTAFSMAVPEAVQTGISVLAMPGYKIKLKRVDTGQKNADGSAIFATTAITWKPSIDTPGPARLLRGGLLPLPEPDHTDAAVLPHPADHTAAR